MEWKLHPIYTQYSVSSEGDVRHIKKDRNRKHRLDKYHYPRINLSHKGKLLCRHIHTLVAECFIGEINGMTVNHKDGNKLNNYVDNLEIITSSENAKHHFATEQPNPWRIECVVNGIPYRSVRQASLDTGISMDKLYKVNPREFHSDPNRDE